MYLPQASRRCALNTSEFKNELKKLSGGYLFCGEEAYLKRHYLSAVRKEVVAEGDFFNHIVIDGDSYTPELLISSLETLPMMAERKLIEVNGLYYNSMTKEATEELLAILEMLPEYEYNILILYTEPDEIDIGTTRQPSQIIKKLSEAVKPVIFARESPARLAAWVSKHFASQQIIAGPNEVNTMLDRCGCDMFMLSSEIDKLCWYLKSNGRERLTDDDIKAVSCQSKEIASFDFANAILDGKSERAFSILKELKLRKERPEILLSGISKVIFDLMLVKALAERGDSCQAIAKKLNFHEYKASLYLRSASKTGSARLRRIANECAEADLLIKTSQLDSYKILDRLACITLER